MQIQMYIYIEMDVSQTNLDSVAICNKLKIIMPVLAFTVLYINSDKEYYLFVQGWKWLMIINIHFLYKAWIPPVLGGQRCCCISTA